MKLNIALIQFQPILGDLETNRKKISAWLTQIPNHVDVILLPELANSGYHFIHDKQAEASCEVIQTSILVEELKTYATHNDVAIAIGFAEKADGKRYNSALWITSKGVETVYRKAHLFAREQLFFSAGDDVSPVVTWKGVKLGLMICYDWTFPEVWQWMARCQVDIVCHLSNLVMPHAQQMVKTYAFSNHYYIAQSNRVGTERDLTFTGASSIIAPNAEVIVQASLKSEEIIIGTIDTNYARDKQLNPYNHKSRDTRTDLYPKALDHRNHGQNILKQEKKQIRRYIKQYWGTYTPKELHEKSAIALQKLAYATAFKKAQKILLFWSLEDEVYTHDFVREFAKTKKIYLPIMQGSELVISRYTSDENMNANNAFGVFEPSSKSTLHPEDLDLIVVPGVAFDRQGGRLGRGKGFYDRLLENSNAHTIGLGIDFQLMWSVPTEPHDQSLDEVIVS
ncbi:5-formyltetrahydrofolate cyclo-ligase [Prolixibacteraceae bacterium]|nr:5-formyltetrahydrofolate cyclo-ligase [Prolixibacteraceae bacterium]